MPHFMHKLKQFFLHEAASINRLLFISAVCGTLGYSSIASAQTDWYRDIGSHCSGHLPLVAGVQTFFAKRLSFISIAPGGNLAVTLAPAQIAEFSSRTPFVFEVVDLSGAQAVSLKKVFAASADQRVPLLFKVANAFLINFTIPATLLNVGTGFAFDFLYSQVDSIPTSIENAGAFLAEGGKLEQQLSIKKSAQGRFVLSQAVYSVPVGKESRTFIISACIYPIAVQVSEFQTEGPFNNKIVKPRDGKNWGVWDIEDKKWDSRVLRYLSQDADSYLFESDEIENNNVVGKSIHRISLLGGVWQVKNSDWPQFKNLYLKVSAR